MYQTFEERETKTNILGSFPFLSPRMHAHKTRRTHARQMVELTQFSLLHVKFDTHTRKSQNRPESYEAIFMIFEATHTIYDIQLQKELERHRTQNDAATQESRDTLK